MKTILIQLDTDPQPASFDRVVAVDAGVDEVFAYGEVTPERVEPLVHGAMFTRAPGELAHTAIFIGGSDVAAGESVLQRVQKTFFGPLRVSVMMDSNGSNTTAAAAVLMACKHLSLRDCEALILGGTGPVGQRAAQLLAGEGARVRVGSRAAERAKKVCDSILSAVDGAQVSPQETGTDSALAAACRGAELILSAGAAGVRFLTAEQLGGVKSLRVAIDLNAVPPAGLGGIEPTDKATDRDGLICYGAVGVGRAKMKIHKAAVRRLFEANDRVLDTEAVYRIGEEILSD